MAVRRIINDALEIFEELDKKAEDKNPAQYHNLGLESLANSRIRIFTGTIKDISASIGLTESQTYTAMELLYRIQALTRLKASSNKNPGIIALNYKPTRRQLEDYYEKSSATNNRVSPSKSNAILLELSDLRNRVSKLEKRLNELCTDDIRRGETLP